VLYLIGEGRLECHIVMKQGDAPVHLKNYEEGEAFGELALLYNCPRAATIKALTNATLYTLDRETFNAIVKEQS